MSLTVFSQAPYYDDYDADKRYLRMLFRPGVSLQVRELNQLQTYLQTQIERLGLHLFKEGSMVIPGQTAIDTKMVYLKVQAETNGVAINTILSMLPGQVITGASGVQAQVITYSAAEGTDPITLYVRYISSSDTDKTVKEFSAKFIKPVVVPTNKDVEIKVSGVVGEISDGLAKIDLTVICDEIKVLGSAKATVQVK